jgi:hypothetical protein
MGSLQAVAVQCLNVDESKQKEPKPETDWATLGFRLFGALD